MSRGRFSRYLIQRLVILGAGNVLLLVAIALLIKEGGSFGEVLQRAGPNVAPIVIAGFAVTGIIFTGAIDLSIASIIVVSGTVFGLLVQRGLPPWFCFGACVLSGWILCMINGALIRGLRIPSIIVTLAGLAFYRGLALIIADTGIENFSGNISIHEEKYHAPGRLWAGRLLAFVLLATLVWEQFAKRPRTWLALGNSEEACRLMGLNPGKILQSAFGVAGLFLGVAALIYVTRVQAIEPARMALGLELQVIGAVILGGTNIFGGEGSYLGTALGAFFLYFVLELLIYAGVSPYFQEVIVGSIIIAVIGLDCGLHRKEKLMEELA